MADDADRAQVDLDMYQQALSNKKPFVLEPGEAGECDLCGEESPRLVNGHCAPCRDKHGLK